MNDVPARAALADEREQPLDLAVGERGRRLVEDDHAARGRRARARSRGSAARRRRGGRPAPSRSMRRVIAEDARSELARVRLESSRRRRGRSATARGRARGSRRPTCRGRATSSWCTTAMPARRASRVDAERLRRAIDDDLALVAARRVHAAEDLDQRRLAGAVLADEAEHLARLDRERDVVQRAHARELLADAAQLDHVRRLLPDHEQSRRAASSTRVAGRAAALTRARDAGAAVEAVAAGAASPPVGSTGPASG